MGGFRPSPVLINCPLDNATYVSFCTAAMKRVLQPALTLASHTPPQTENPCDTHSQLVFARQNQHSSIVNILISFFTPAGGNSGQSWIQCPDWLHR